MIPMDIFTGKLNRDGGAVKRGLGKAGPRRPSVAEEDPVPLRII
jgi:hypothetical protein